jgi:hypothetical protein
MAALLPGGADLAHRSELAVTGQRLLKFAAAILRHSVGMEDAADGVLARRRSSSNGAVSPGCLYTSIVASPATRTPLRCAGIPNR